MRTKKKKKMMLKTEGEPHTRQELTERELDPCVWMFPKCPNGDGCRLVGCGGGSGTERAELS